MAVVLLAETIVGDTAVRYVLNESTGRVECSLLPADLPFELPDESAEELTPPAFVHFGGDSSGLGFGGGRTMRYGATNAAFRYAEQRCGDRRIDTLLRHGNGCELRHVLCWLDDEPVFYIHTELTNPSDQTVEVEQLESFNLGGIGRSLDDDAFTALRLHRFRSHWGSEAVHECVSAADWQLERYHYVVRSERYGQVGSMPVRGFHPFGAVEDPINGIFWGAQLAWSGSWQMEFSIRSGGALAFGGGLADFEFGHWMKRLAPGETLTTPTAIAACRRGTFDAFCQRLVRGIEQTLTVPEGDAELPVIFNEWCTSWGSPEAENLKKLADFLQPLPIGFLVIDAGWYKREGSNWAAGQGDWTLNSKLFPEGLEPVVRHIRERGMIPGIWFEAEVAGEDSDAYHCEVEHMLHRRGRPLTVGTRRFWDLNDPEARRIIGERVISFLKENRFGYVKIDYNETIGVGCDHPDSFGEGLRLQTLGTHWFFRHMAERNPGLVIENCASGGHRLEPAMLALTAMSSFSDAHEESTIPAIAASLHRLIPVRHNQIWAVIRKDADLKRIAYLMTGAMLGRICLSGDITDVSPAQFDLIRRGLAFYRELVPALKSGDSEFHPSLEGTRNVLRGAQTLLRRRRDGRELIVYFHIFSDAPESVAAELPEGTWEPVDAYQAPETGVLEFDGGRLTLRHPAEFSGHVQLFRLR